MPKLTQSDRYAHKLRVRAIRRRKRLAVEKRRAERDVVKSDEYAEFLRKVEDD